MKKRNIVVMIFTSFASICITKAQPSQSKQISPSYVENCTQQQIEMHQKVKDISADYFRSFCECTSQQLITSLSSAQLEELNKVNKRPTWFKPAEEAATKNCLKNAPKTQV